MWGYEDYVPVAKKRANAQKKLEKLRKKNPHISPVIIEGKKLAKTWWGLAWNQNLESYADYDNRIDRGRSYVRNGMVLDLSIDKGEVHALVQGSDRSPYDVSIQIKPLPKERWEQLLGSCSQRVQGIAELAEGKFPKELQELFTMKGGGLFPSPKEITFGCSCYDWASMCKHVAAALYGIGARLDTDPLLFFKMRNIDFEDLLKKSVEQKMQELLKNADKPTSRSLDNEDIHKLFGL